MSDERKIQIAALTGGVKTPSARFRIRQYIARFAAAGIEVREHLPYFEKSCGLPSPFKAAARIPALFRSRLADIIWLNKELVQGYPTFERLLKKPRVLDVDDAIWHSLPLGKLGVPYIAKAMDVIVAGNSYLANYFEQYCSAVHVIPTGIDLNRFCPGSHSQQYNMERFIIGWTGMACNYKYLDTIAVPLQQFLSDNPNAELMIVSNRPWKNPLIDPRRICFIQWTPENETAVLDRMSVGIMPLADDKWSKGKCSFKMLQYMAASLPVIASPVGMNVDVFKKGLIGFPTADSDEWIDAMKLLARDPDLRVEMGRTGRAVVEQHYNADIISQKLARIFKSLL